MQPPLTSPQTNHHPPKPRFSIAAVLSLVTPCAVLLGWYVDHRQLKQQIPTPVKMQNLLYSVTNATPKLATQKLVELLPDESITNVAETNSIVIRSSETTHKQIEMVLRYIDRSWTEFIDVEDEDQVASKSD